MAKFSARLFDLAGRAWRLGRAELTALIAIAVAAVGLLSFIEVADEMSETDGQAFDQAVLHGLRPGPDPRNPLGPPWLEQAMSELTALGGVTNLLLLGAMAVGFLLILRRRGSAFLVAFSLIGGVAISQTLKGLYGRDRPPDIFRAEEVLNPSFPSGHAMLATVAYLTLAALLSQALERKRLRAFVFACGLFLAFAVGVSRVYLGLHWASDVLAGWSLGAAWAAVCWLAAYALERRRLHGPAAASKDPAVTGE